MKRFLLRRRGTVCVYRPCTTSISSSKRTDNLHGTHETMYVVTKFSANKKVAHSLLCYTTIHMIYLLNMTTDGFTIVISTIMNKFNKNKKANSLRMLNLHFIRVQLKHKVVFHFRYDPFNSISVFNNLIL